MRVSCIVAAAAVLLAAGGVARAAQFPQRDPEFPPRDYTCHVDGENAPLGALRCLRTPQGRRAAECVVAINMSSWQPVDQACP